MVLSGCLFAMGALLVIDNGIARADINTQGNICVAALEEQSIEYNTSGVENPSASPVSIECAIPRPSVPSTDTTTFFVDGANFNGASTNCTLFVSEFSGTFRFLQILPTLSGPASRISVQFAAGRIANSDHVTLLCALRANRGGRISGVNAVGP